MVAADDDDNRSRHHHDHVGITSAAVAIASGSDLHAVFIISIGDEGKEGRKEGRKENVVRLW